MNENNNKTNMKDSVLSKIKSGNVAMRPRWHFILKSILAVVGIALVALTLIYFVSFTFFILRLSGVFFVPIFGMKGLMAFVFSTPWLLVLVAIIFLIILEVLVRRYSFGYHKPLLYTVLGIVIVSMVGTFLISQTPFHQRMLQYAERGDLPVVGSLYRGYGLEKNEGVHKGVVEEVTDTGFYITSRKGDYIEVSINPDTRLPLGFDFAIGDSVVVLGERIGNVIEAEGVRTITEYRELRRRE